MADTPKFMTTREAAGYCRLHPASLALMRTQGLGPKYLRPIDARRYLYRETDLINWIEGRPDETPEQRTARFNSCALGHDASRQRNRRVRSHRRATRRASRGGRSR